MSSALGARVVPLHRHDVFVSRLSASPVPLPQPLIDLFMGHRRGKPWNEIAHCTDCKRKMLTRLAAEIGRTCGHCRKGGIQQTWTDEKAQVSLVNTMNNQDQGALFVAFGHVESSQPVVIGFAQIALVKFGDLTVHLGHDVLSEVGMYLGRKERYAVIDNLAVLSPEHDSTTIPKLLDSVIDRFGKSERDHHSILTLVGTSTLYETCLAQRGFRLCKNLPDRVAFMGRA